MYFRDAEESGGTTSGNNFTVEEKITPEHNIKKHPYGIKLSFQQSASLRKTPFWPTRTFL